MLYFGVCIFKRKWKLAIVGEGKSAEMHIVDYFSNKPFVYFNQSKSIRI